jgi:hypothetical protein
MEHAFRMAAIFLGSKSNRSVDWLGAVVTFCQDKVAHPLKNEQPANNIVEPHRKSRRLET